MMPDEQTSYEDKKSSRRRISWDLFYYERGPGGHLYFRITSFAIILMLAGLLVGVTILIIDSWKPPKRQTNINISLPSASNSLDNQSIRQVPPPPSLPKVNKRSATGSPSPPALNRNTNNQAISKPSPVSESPPGK